MEKRLFIAVILSIAFLVAWGALLPRIFPGMAKQREQATAPTTTAPTPAEASAPEVEVRPAAPPRPAVEMPAVEQPAVAAESRQIVTVERDAYTAVFSNRGAQLISFHLKNHRARDGGPINLVKERPADRNDFPFAVQTPDPAVNALLNSGLYTVERTPKGDGEQIVFRYASGGVSAVKTFVFTREYPFDFRIEIEGAPYRTIIGPGIRNLEAAEAANRFLASGNGVVAFDEAVEVVAREEAPPLVVMPSRPEFVGVQDNYFLTALLPTRSDEAVFLRYETAAEAEGEEPRRELYAGLNSVEGVVAGRAFFGPKEAELLERYGLGETLSFGFFGFIARLLLYALTWVYGITLNYGWAIVVLTIIIKILLYPLQHKSIVSMKKMQQVQPKVNALREKFKKAKTDPQQRQKLNEEMMKLYRQEGINPMSGCFPILLQLPILWAFYSLLSQAIELRGADFMLWINDLSEKDPYYITPILMTITMFIQQWMTPTTMDPTQRKIFLIMPLVFGWIFKEFPSGLVLYWLVQNVLTIIQQAIMNRYWKEHPEKVPA